MIDCIYSKQDINNNINEICNEIHVILKEVKNNIYNGIKSKSSIQTITQLFYNISFKNDCQKSILDMIISHAILAEKIAPGSFIQTINFIIDSFTNKNSAFYDNKIILSKQPTKNDIQNFLKNTNSIHDMSFIINDAVHLAGYGGKIIIEKSSTNIVSVELCRGYTFDVRIPWKLSIKLEKPKTIVIDGYVENVSEIHHLLESASEKKESIVLFVRGLSNEVLHTLKVNYDRGTLQIIPVIVNFDIEGINTINDISVVTGSDMVSSNKGDLISSIKYENLSRVDAITIHSTKITIQNSSTFISVKNQINNINKKRSESSVNDIEVLYDKRIRSLTPNHVIIRLPDDQNFVMKSQIIDNSLRGIKSMIEHGVHHLKYDEPVLASVHHISGIFAKKCIDTLNSINLIIT